MPWFRNRPVVIQADFFDGSRESADGLKRMHGARIALEMEFDPRGAHEWTGKLIVIDGQTHMIATAGDWILRGVEGALYPVAGNVFKRAYEEIT